MNKNKTNWCTLDLGIPLQWLSLLLFIDKAHSKFAFLVTTLAIVDFFLGPLVGYFKQTDSGGIAMYVWLWSRW